jgi:hypothetical protein
MNKSKNKMVTKIARIIIISAIFSFLSISSYGQNSSEIEIKDTIKKSEQKFKEHSPKKASLMSTFLPGLGQIYNDKYWKVPVIYAAEGTLLYFYHWNNIRYIEYNKAYIDMVNGRISDYKGVTSAERLKQAKDYYRRYRDLNIIGMFAVYILNIIDASVDAHLYNFDVSKDLSLKIQPKTIYTENSQTFTGISCSISF